MRARSSPASERPLERSEALPPPRSARPFEASEDVPRPRSTPTPAGGPPPPGPRPPPPPPPCPRPCAAASADTPRTKRHASARPAKTVRRFLPIEFPPFVREIRDVRGKRGERKDYSTPPGAVYPGRRSLAKNNRNAIEARR